MSLVPVITVDITIDSTGVPRQGFGTPLIASHNATWDERTRSYGGTAEVAEDWPTDSPEYLCAAAAFSQESPPDEVKIGRVDSAVLQRYEIKVTSAVNSKLYSLAVSGEDLEADDVEVTADAGTSVAEIHDALVTALNAFPDKTFTAAFAALVLVDFTFTAAADDVVTRAAHTLQTGDGPFQLTTSAADLPLNLLTATDYYAIRLTADTFKLATSRANAFAGTAVDIADAGTGVHTVDIQAGTKSPTLAFTVTGDASGNWFSLSVAMKDAAFIQMSQTHAAGTLDEDLAAILDEDDDWYCLLTLYNSKAYVQEAAAWVQANGRIYAFDCSDTEALTTAFDIEAVASTDLLGAICASGYTRVLSAYHQRPAAFFAASWMGDWLPTTPGKATAALKTLVGPETTKLKTTYFNNLKDRRANVYLFRGARGITWEGMVGSTTNLYLDVTRNVDFVIDGVGTVGFGILAGSPIVYYTAEGIAQLAGGIRGFLTGEATDNGVFDKDPPPNVIPPQMDDIPVQDRKERVLRTLKFSGRLAGAIHAADIDGTVSF